MLAFYDRHKTDVRQIDDRLRLIADMVAERRPQRLLDAACGRGTFLIFLRSRLPSIECEGSDISPDSVAETHSHGIKAQVADLERSLPFPDEHFDCVVLGEVIEHLVDPDSALINVSRVLRRGGTLIVTTPNLASWFNRGLLMLGVQPLFTETSLHVNLGRRTPMLGQWKPTQGHLKIFVKSALVEMLEANGFTINRFAGAPFAQPNPFSKLDRLLARFPGIASNFVVDCTNQRSLATVYPRLKGWLE